MMIVRLNHVEVEPDERTIGPFVSRDHDRIVIGYEDRALEMDTFPDTWIQTMPFPGAHDTSSMTVEQTFYPPGSGRVAHVRGTLRVSEADARILLRGLQEALGPERLPATEPRERSPHDVR